MAAGLRSEIAEAAARLGDLVPDAHWLPGLARVLDDEPLVVIDHQGRHGFRLTMSGVGDNFQLHTLLADRLIGDPAHGLMPGERPAQSWVSAATTAPPPGPAGRPIRRRFRMFDGSGAYIYPEGVPADISLTAGTRVIVLHPPLGAFGWINGRTYVHMVPELTLDQIMSSTETGTWYARAAPARETDFMAH